MDEDGDTQTSRLLFSHLKLAPYEPLNKINERQICNNCGRKRMYFCYDCRVYVGEVGSMAPSVELPIHIDIVKHQLELNGKSTAIHAALLAPYQTRIFDKFSDVPNYSNSFGTVVLYPSKHSISIDEFYRRNGRIRKIILLDSTWNTVAKLRSLAQLKMLPFVHLRNYQTNYWRPQKGLSNEHLATIEAIYFACRECLEAERRENGFENSSISANDGNLDNLLFWFYFFRKKVPQRKLENLA